MTQTFETLFLHTAKICLIKHQVEQVKACLRALNDTQIWWRPNTGANAIGNLVLHLCGSTRFYLVHAISEADDVRDRSAEFSDREEIPREELLQQVDNMVIEVERVLEMFDQTQLLKTNDRTRKTSTNGQVILYQLLHFSTHVGQLVYATKLLKEGAIDELWRQTNPN